MEEEVQDMEINPEYYTFQIPGWVNDIYLLGTKRFTPRDGYKGIPLDAHQAVKQEAADSLEIMLIDGALANGFINAQEHADTVALIQPTV